MQTHYIYLVHVREHRESNKQIYKIGKTKQDNFNRLKSYPRGTVLLFMTICNDCDTTEKTLITLFHENFIHHPLYGNEYFEGDYKKMIDLIYSIVKDETPIDPIKLLYDKLFDTPEHLQNFIIKCNEINETFPDFVNDETFKSSNSKFIIISPDNIVKYLNPEFSFDSTFKTFKIETEYFVNLLISKKIISYNKPFNINEQEPLILSQQININIPDFKDIPLKELDFETKIKTLFNSNILINNTYPFTILSKYCKNSEELTFLDLNVELIKSDESKHFALILSPGNLLWIHKIKNKFFLTSTIKNNLPYRIKCEGYHYNIQNYEGDIIGTGILTKEKTKTRLLFQKNSLPWDTDKFKEYCENYKKIFEENNLSECKFINPYISQILDY